MDHQRVAVREWLFMDTRITQAEIKAGLRIGQRVPAACPTYPWLFADRVRPVSASPSPSLSVWEVDYSPRYYDIREESSPVPQSVPVG